MSAPRVLFVCVENSCRSQMAEALGRRAGLEVASAGSRPSGRVHPGVAAALAEWGLDVGAQHSKGLAALDPREYDALVTMGCGDTCADVTAALREDWPLPDPRGGDADVFRRVRDELERRIADLARRLAAGRAGAAGA